MTYSGGHQEYGYSDPSAYPPAAAPITVPVHPPPPPMPAPPTSGPPTSGFPGQPIGYPLRVPPKRRDVAVPVLAALLALAVIATGLFAGLWADRSNKFDASETRSNQRQVALDQSGTELRQARTDLTTKADELTKAQQDLRSAEAEKTELKRQRDVIGTCLKLLFEALDALEKGDRTTAQNKINEMKAPCNEAEVILGI
jgi:hypothetical protein